MRPASQFAGGGEPVAEVADVGGSAAGRDLAGPPGEARHADAAVGEAAFDAA